ncbi:hypothetical protein ABPG73_002764 [Tetrahymena malaccensis]
MQKKSVFFLLTLLILCQTAQNENQFPIKNVVVLMMENRSFDHMLGWMKTSTSNITNPNIDGLTGQECNPKLLSGKICVSPNATDHTSYDPFHLFSSTTERIYNCKYDLTNSNKSKNPCKNHASLEELPNMQGFVTSAERLLQSGQVEMSGHLPENVPIISTLANEFALFDRYFASFPGCTNPNRMFMHTGTSDGHVGNGERAGQIKNTTIQEVLEKNGYSWRYYYEGDALDWFLYIEYFNNNFNTPGKFSEMEQFYSDAATGNLPNYTFINPSESIHPNLNNTKSFGLPNDQHPNHSIREGERLIKNVYEALRNGPLWNQTLLIITYDEHGGFYDHVPPPQKNIPSPDNKVNANGFDFTRLGIRVPTIAISPWIEKGTLVNKPTEEQKPFENSEFDHTSIGKTIFKIFGIDYNLSKRSEWAASFENILKLRKEPRSDCISQLAYIPPPSEEEIKRLYSLPIQDTLKQKINKICRLHKPRDPNCGENIENYTNYVDFINQLDKILLH